MSADQTGMVVAVLVVRAELAERALRRVEALLHERDRPDVFMTEEHFVAQVRAVVEAYR